MEVEIWKDVPNYEGLYQVSSLGRIKSLKKYGLTNERILKCVLIGKYLTITLAKKDKKKTFTVHKLVAMAFLCHVPDGTMKIVVDHIDNDKLNNRADNLQLISNRENVSKDMKVGTSRFIGVHWCESCKKWRVKIKFNNTDIHLGYFDLEIDAANAYQKALKEIKQGLDLNILYPKRVKSSQYKGVYYVK